MTALVCLVALAQDAPTPGDVVSKMILRFHDAVTVTGTIDNVIRLGTQVYTVKTDLAIERPLRLRVNQVFSGAPLPYLLVSDGNEFSYNPPSNSSATEQVTGDRLIERVLPGMGLGDIYRAAWLSLADRSPVLDLAIGDKRDLANLRDQWATLEFEGEAPDDGEKAVLVGDWRLRATEDVSARFRLEIDGDGNLLSYSVKQPESLAGVAVERSWKVDLKVGERIDAKLFTVVK